MSSATMSGSYSCKKTRKKAVMRLHRELHRKSSYSFNMAKSKLKNYGILLAHNHKNIKLRDESISNMPHDPTTPSDDRLIQWIRTERGKNGIDPSSNLHIEESEEDVVTDILPLSRVDTTLTRAVDESMIVIIKHYQGMLLLCEYSVQQLHEYKLLLVVQQLRWGIELLPENMRINPAYYLISFNRNYNEFELIKLDYYQVGRTISDCEQEARKLERKRINKYR